MFPVGDYYPCIMGPRKVTWFPHRHNPNGSWDSICSACMATIATVENEAELVRREASHVCSVSRLFQFRTKPLTSDR